MSKFYSGFLLATASVGFALLLLELGFRTFGVAYTDFYRPDPLLGFSLRPGAHGRYSQEGAAYVRINAAGMRDGPHAVAKPPGVIRVAVLGDSFAEAFQVPQDSTYWAVMERALSRCPAFAGRRVEVLNFGVSGYGTAQQFLQLRHRVAPFSPDVVLLSFFGVNDLRNNSKTLEYNLPARPFFARQGDRLVLDTLFRADPWYQREAESRIRLALRWVVRHSRVLQVANEARLGLMIMLGANDPEGDLTDTRFALGGDAAVFGPPPDTAWSSAWDITERLLAAAAEEARKQGAEFYVATLSHGLQVDPDSGRRAEYARRRGASDLFYPDRRISAAGRRDGYVVINLAPQLLRYASEREVLLHGFDGRGDGHWNPRGHDVAGRILAREICGRFGGAD